MSNHLGDTNKMVGEDHIRDATKMVSDTPRTEAEVNRQKCWSDDLITIDANFACQLERELNAANSRIELLMSANADVARIAGERDAAEKRICLLIAKLDKYQDRIQRLEDAGDDLHDGWRGNRENKDKYLWAWLKAKEAKL